MKTLPYHSRLLVAGLLCLWPLAVQAAAPAVTPELAEARARLLEYYQKGRTDSDNGVKQLREKIAALEYVAEAKASAAPEPPPRFVNVNFSGGSISAFIAAAEKGGYDGFNVVAEKNDLTLELPPFTIHNADPSALAAALDGLLRPRGYTLQPIATRMLPGQAPVFVLRKLNPNEIDHRLASDFQSFQLAPYLEYQSVDDIVGAIRAAWELDPARKPDNLRLKFHPPTGILLVSAARDGINIVSATLAQLRRSPEANLKLAPKPDPQPAALDKK